MLFENFFYLGLCRSYGGEEILKTFKMIVLVEGDLAGAAKELGHEGSGALLGAAGLGAPAPTYLDHDVAELRDLKDRLDHVSLIAGRSDRVSGR